MHICFVTPEYVLSNRLDGGLANYIKKTGVALLQKGHSVSVVVLSDLENVWDDHGVTVYEVKRSRFEFWRKKIPKSLRMYYPLLCQLVNSKAISRQVTSIHHKEKIDIIQSSSYQAPGFFLLDNKGIPLCCRVSSYTPVVRSAYGKQRTLPEYLSDWLEIQQVARATNSFAPSNFTASIFLRMEACQVRVIRTLFELEDLEFDNSILNSMTLPETYFLFFGTLSRIKGVDFLAEVLPDIFSIYTKVSMVFIGRDDGLPSGEKVFKHIEARCASYKNRLFYLKALPKSQLYPFVSNATAVLLPSRVDNYPNVCIESLALGTPVIGTKHSSLEEIIIDGKNGFLAENSDPTSIKKAILRMLTMNEDENKFMKGEIARCVTNMRQQDPVKDLVDFYKETIEIWNAKRS